MQKEKGTEQNWPLENVHRDQPCTHLALHELHMGALCVGRVNRLTQDITVELGHIIIVYGS